MSVRVLWMQFPKRLPPAGSALQPVTVDGRADGALGIARPLLAILWAGLSGWWIVSQQLVSGPTLIIVGLVTALIFVRDVSAAAILRIFRDWGLVLAWFFCYALSRAAADTLGMPVQEQIWIDIDLVLGLGETPTHRLQRLIDWDAPPALWELSLSAMYVSHYVVNFAVLIVMYQRDRLVWGRWYRRFVLMGMIGIIGYILLPSVPPWMSSDTGTVPLVHESLARGWEVVEVEWIHRLFEFGRNKANPIAAMPSLHAAFPALLFLFWAPRVGRVLKAVLAFYALYMGFTIVITGQHWIIDMFAGWLVAYVAHRTMTRLEQWNEARQATAETPDAPPHGDDESESEPMVIDVRPPDSPARADRRTPTDRRPSRPTDPVAR